MRHLPITILVVFLACAATAEAKTLTLKGGVKGDSNSAMTLKLKVNGQGVPSKVVSFTYSGVDTYQSSAPGQTGEPCSIGEQQGKLPPATPSVYPGDRPGTFTFNAVDPNGGAAIQARGSLTPYPKVKKGEGYMTFVQPDHSVCASKGFKLKKG